MDRRGMADSWLATLVERFTGQVKAVPDEDGSHFVRVRVTESEVALVELNVAPDMHVLALARAGADAVSSPAFLERLNTMNRQLTAVSLVLVEDTVWVRGRHPALTMDASEYGHLVESVAFTSRHAYQSLSEDYPITSPFYPLPADVEPPADDGDQVEDDSDQEAA